MKTRGTLIKADRRPYSLKNQIELTVAKHIEGDRYAVARISFEEIDEELHRSHAITSAIRRDCEKVSIDVRFEHETAEYIYVIELSPDAQLIRGEALVRMPPGSRSDG